MLFKTIGVLTLLGFGNTELDRWDHNDYVTNDLNSKNNKNEISVKTQYFKSQYDNDFIIEDISKFLESLSPKIIDHLGQRKHTKLEWWKTCIFYEIYPKSFKDTTGNGIGDIRGVIEKIPYIKDLGIGAVWLTPIYPSPGFDSGYDITNFTNIDQMMGSMSDFEELLKKLHENGIKLILDFVPNHTSHQHVWFNKSIQRIEPYTDYYVWADAKYVNETRQPPNNWLTYMNKSIWEWNEKRNQYYLHQFFNEQPDLNFWNPLVREEIKNAMKFWLDKGVDGFRLDALSRLYEKQDLADMKDPLDRKEMHLYVNGLNETYIEVQTWRALIDDYNKMDGLTRILIVETYEEEEYMLKFFGNSTHPGAHFPLFVYLTYIRHQPAKFCVEKISYYVSELTTPGKWPSWTIGNHDMIPRPSAKFGEIILDGIIMIQLLLPGTPVVFMGDELGMTDSYLRDDQLIDSMSLEFGYNKARERVRTPFQWNSKAQAGFSNKTKTWLPVNPNYVTINVEKQSCAPRSHLKIFKEIAKLRQLEVFQTGDVRLYEVSKYVFAFSRSKHFLKSYFIVVNVGSEMENVNIRKVQHFLPSTMTVRVASLNAEQDIGDEIEAESFTLRPGASLVLDSSFF